MSASGNKGKFSERVIRILFSKKRTLVNGDKLRVEDSNKMYINFLKVVAAIPGFVYGNLTINSKDENNNVNASADKKEVIVNSRKEKREIINAINVNEIKIKQSSYYKNNKDINNGINKNVHFLDNNEKIYKVKELEKSIINLIKKDLIKIVNELEILQSELYILSEVNGESKVLKDCQRELDQVKNILCKIDKLKEKYDFLRDNYDFEYLLEIDNDDIVDKIIELRDAFGNNELRAVSENYKLLDVYRYLYLKIDNLQEKVAAFSKKKEEEEQKLKERDIDFEKLKRDVYNVQYINSNYEDFVNRQNQILREIDDNVNTINSYEHVNFHLKGFNELFKTSFKYFGLLMVSPLKGIIPSIATETLITGNLIKNLYNSLEWEEQKKLVYETIDYSNIINNAISDLDSTSRIVDSTLDDIVHLKIKYNEKFKQYHGDFLQYKEIMHKISDMENKIIGNKIKIEMMKKRALDQKRANNKKLKLVQKLNDKENHK